MLTELKTLPLVNIEAGLPCSKPDRNIHPVTDENPAVEVMTDFKTVTPVTAEPFYSLEFALDRMKTMGVRMLLVTDEQDNIDGVITSYDLQSEKPIRYAEENDVKYDDMNIGMIMTPVTETPAVDFDYVNRTLVRHIINTMKEVDRPHILVVENAKDGKQKIRGMFSTSHIGKLLGRSIYEPLKASHSLAEIRKSIG